jgi:uncharacterized protein (AIM24 family)
MGFFLQKLSGTGTSFLAGGGTIMQKFLPINESIIVDTNSILAFSETVK